MIKEEFRNLIQRLNEKTLKGQLAWNKTSSSGQFKLILDNATFVVTFRELAYPEPSIAIDLYDTKGEGITIADQLKSDKDYSLLADFYENIKSDYMQIPQTISSVLSELSVDEKIGKIDVSTKTDSLPF